MGGVDVVVVVAFEVAVSDPPEGIGDAGWWNVVGIVVRGSMALQGG